MPGDGNIENKYRYRAKKIVIIYALLASFIWHFLWCVVFKVDLNSKELKVVSIPTTVFLSDFFENSFRGRKADIGSKSKDKAVIGLMEKTRPVSAILPRNRYFEEMKEEVVFSEKIKANLGKAESVLVGRPLIERPASISKTLEIEGPLSQREVLFISQKPMIPEWLDDKGSFSVKDKLFVDNSGRVIFVEQLISSGSLEVDFLARKYLKKLRFCALGRLEDEDFQWGVVTVKLDSLNDSN
ncbi:MAG: hypothetical protein KAU12_00915 [Candidatus Omnitrophica bacterium]|nr:hypothetical protein [Candidatus Omnitrophota bacterium]